MKKNCRTIKLTPTAHSSASRLSTKFGISMAAAVEVALRELLKCDTIALPARDPRVSKQNTRSALAA